MTEFPCRCDWVVCGVDPCARGATEEDGLCDSCREAHGLLHNAGVSKWSRREERLMTRPESDAP